MSDQAAAAMAAAEESGAQGAWIEYLPDDQARLVWARRSGDEVLLCARLTGSEEELVEVVWEWGRRGRGRIYAQSEKALRLAWGMRAGTVRSRRRRRRYGYR